MDNKKPSSLKFKDKLHKRNDPETFDRFSSNGSENYGNSPNGFKLNK